MTTSILPLLADPEPPDDASRRALTVDQPAVNEVCRIFARILMRLAAESAPAAEPRTGGEA